jgi:hypothetical protein
MMTRPALRRWAGLFLQHGRILGRIAFFPQKIVSGFAILKTATKVGRPE